MMNIELLQSLTLDVPLFQSTPTNLHDRRTGGADRKPGWLCPSIPLGPWRATLAIHSSNLAWSPLVPIQAWIIASVQLTEVETTVHQPMECLRSNSNLYRSYLDLLGILQFWHKDFLSLYILSRQYCGGLTCGMYGTSTVSSQLASTLIWMRASIV